MDAGSLADWANAIGTALTFFGASFAAVVALRSFRAQKEQLRAQLARFDEEQSQRRYSADIEQARHVAVWTVRTARRWHVYVANSSGLPVYEMLVGLSGAETAARVYRGVQSPTAPKRSDMLTLAVIALFPPEFSVDLSPSSPELQAVCVFTDAAGQRWRRDGDGRLQRVQGDDDLPGELVSQLQLFEQHSKLYWAMRASPA